jgi:large subunit ribosomal protein L18
MKKQILTLAKRRKREGKTNYNKRLSLIKSNKPRLVIRPTNANMVAQVVEYLPDGNKVIAGAYSKELEKLGWKFSKGNTPAAYLTGLLAGKKAKEKGVKEAVLDIGLRSPIKGSRIFACMKGFVDAGVNVPHSNEILPKEDRIKGQHIAKYDSKKSDLPKVFDEIKSKIVKVK